MSGYYRITQQRWAAKSLVVSRWHVKPLSRFRRGDLLCDLNSDGETVAIYADLPPDDHSGVYGLFVEEGNEVGVWGELFEYAFDGSGGVRERWKSAVEPASPRARGLRGTGPTGT
jgi:hypothetical protein